MSLGMVAFWATVLFGVVWLVRGGWSPHESRPGPPQSGEDAPQVLKRRLAAGEITVHEYEELRRVIDERPEADARKAAHG